MLSLQVDSTALFQSLQLYILHIYPELLLHKLLFLLILIHLILFQFYLNNPDLRNQIAGNGQKKVSDHHTLNQRAAEILDKMAKYLD